VVLNFNQVKAAAARIGAAKNVHRLQPQKAAVPCHQPVIHTSRSNQSTKTAFLKCKCYHA